MWCCSELLYAWWGFFVVLGVGVGFFLFLFFNCFSFRGVLLKGFILWFLGASSPSLHSSACVELDHALDSQSGRLALNVCSPACAYCRAKWATAVWAMPKQVPFLLTDEITIPGIKRKPSVFFGFPWRASFVSTVSAQGNMYTLLNLRVLLRCSGWWNQE